MRFVIATFNADKYRELIALLDLPGTTYVSLRELPGASAAAEVGHTLEENALLKARAAAGLAGLPAIADDTGLEVDALGGRPGVYTARFAGPNATYSENVHHLLAVLAGHGRAQRRARFRTVCAAVFPDGREVVGTGALEGFITDAPRGDDGFGYDPVFEVAGDGRTLAEMTLAEKNRISHRARAVNDLVVRLGR